MRQAVAQGQVFDPGRLPFPLKIIRRGAHHRATDGQLAGDEIGIQVIGDAHCQIHPLLDQIDGALDQHQIHRRARMQLDVIRHDARQMTRAERHAGRDPQQPLGRIVGRGHGAAQIPTMSSICRQRGSVSAPAGVRLSRRVVRCNNRTPTHCSISARYRDTMALDMSKCTAAADKLPLSATSTNTCMAFKRSMIVSNRA